MEWGGSLTLYVVLIIDGEIFSNMKLMNEKRELFLAILGRKKDKSLGKIESINQHKEKTFDEIDSFFNEIIKKAEARRQKLKAEYLEIEAKERLRLEKARDKLINDLQ